MMGSAVAVGGVGMWAGGQGPRCPDVHTPPRERRSAQRSVVTPHPVLRSPRNRGNFIQCELYAKLIGLILAHWLVVLGCWHVPAHSLVKASRVVAQHARLLAQAFDRHRAFGQALATLLQAVTVGCRLERRRTQPNAYQLWLDPSLAGLT